jgi:hypothetical protein
VELGTALELCGIFEDHLRWLFEKESSIGTFSETDIWRIDEFLKAMHGLPRLPRESFPDAYA